MNRNRRASNIQLRTVSGSFGGFTLVEMVTAMAIISILMLAIGSALSFSLKVSTGQGAIDQTNLLTAADAADQIADDLHVAANFTEHTNTSIAFSVPDRTGGGTPDQVRYAWDGTSGHALTRQFLPAATPTLTAANATYTPVNLLNGVTNFSLNYFTRQMGTAAVVDSALLSPANPVVATTPNYNIDGTHWACQCVTVPVPLNCSTYSITRIQVYIKSAGSQEGILKMRVTNASGGKPGAVYQEQPFYESSFSTALEFAEVKFTNLTNLPANQPICIVIGYTSGGGAVGILQYQTSLTSILTGGSWSTSADSGTNWTAPVLTSSLPMYIYGTTP